MRAATVVQLLAGLVLSFTACFILLVIAPLRPEPGVKVGRNCCVVYVVGGDVAVFSPKLD